MVPDGGLRVGPTEAEEIVGQVVTQRQNGARGVLEEFTDEGKGLSSFEQHMEDVWRELEALAAEADGPTA